jgi:hypothetical protein
VTTAEILAFNAGVRTALDHARRVAEALAAAPAWKRPAFLSRRPLSKSSQKQARCCSLRSRPAPPNQPLVLLHRRHRIPPKEEPLSGRRRPN